jgi:hypothetical protein
VTRQSYVSPRVSRRRPPTTHHAHPAPPPTHNSKAASQGNVVSKTYPTPPREKSVIRVRSKGAASQPQHPTGESHWSNPLPPAFASVSVPRTPAKPWAAQGARQPAAGRPWLLAGSACLRPACGCWCNNKPHISVVCTRRTRRGRRVAQCLCGGSELVCRYWPHHARHAARYSSSTTTTTTALLRVTPTYAYADPVPTNAAVFLCWRRLLSTEARLQHSAGT